MGWRRKRIYFNVILSFIGFDDIALLLICYHDLNVLCNFLLRFLLFIKKSFRWRSGGSAKSALIIYHQLHSVVGFVKTRNAGQIVANKLGDSSI